MLNIAVIGNRESILVFKSVGFHIVEIEDEELYKAKSKLESLTKGNYAIIFVTETIYAYLKEIINKISIEIEAAIVRLPGDSDIGDKEFLNELSRKAIGTYIAD